ncbi:MAG: hypothetical protein ACHREM_07320 [Polyangiales bacterium]
MKTRSLALAAPFSALALLCTVFTSRVAFAHDEPGGGSISAKPTGDTNDTGANLETDAPKPLNPLRGSLLFVDQSMSAATLDRNQYLSPNQVTLFELWVSPRLYYSPSEHIKFGARFDFFTEETDTEGTTTYKHETVVGDPWLTAGYSTPLKALNDREGTKWGVGWTLRPPLSKASRGQGQYLATGPSASLGWNLALNGDKAKLFQSLQLTLSGSYSHAFTQCTTACPFGTNNTGAIDHGDPGAPTISLDNQIRSGTLTGNTFLAAATGTLSILENLSLDVSMIGIWGENFALPVASVAGQSQASSANDTRLKQSTWFLAAIDWDVTKEFGLSLGYYNLNTVTGLDGTYRDPLYSVDGARIFFTLTAHLDALYADAFMPTPPKTSASRSPMTF